MKSYKIRFTKSSDKMLESNLKHCKKYSPTYADKIERKVYESIKLLKIFPYANPTLRIRGKPGNYKKIIIKHRFLIVFQINNKNINLLYFIDGRQSPRNFFKSLKIFNLSVI